MRPTHTSDPRHAGLVGVQRRTTASTSATVWRGTATLVLAVGAGLGLIGILGGAAAAAPTGLTPKTGAGICRADVQTGRSGAITFSSDGVTSARIAHNAARC
jgi:hypothetical protein